MLDKTASEVIYQVAEAPALFPIPFPFLDKAHIEAELRTADGGVEPLRPGVDYSVAAAANGNGELALARRNVRPGTSLAVRRLVPLTQETLFHNQGPNSPKATEDSLDKLTMIAQQLHKQVLERLPIPEGMAMEEALEVIATAGERLAEIRRAVEAIAESLPAFAVRDDPRFEDERTPTKHAATHRTDGGDPLAPGDIGCLPLPPNTGRTYLAAAEGWVEYAAPHYGELEFEDGVGTFYHSLLHHREHLNQHPLRAITGLVETLDDIQSGMERMKLRVDAFTQAFPVNMETHTVTTDGVSTEYVLRHSLDSENVIVQTFDADTGQQVHFGATAAGRDAVTLEACPPRPAGERYRAVLLAPSGGTSPFFYRDEDGITLKPAVAEGVQNAFFYSDATGITIKD